MGAKQMIMYEERIAPVCAVLRIMIDTIAIRPARSQENRLLSDLAFRSKAYWGYSPEFMAACRAELSISEEDISNPQRRYYLAELNGKIVGYYALARLSMSVYELDALFVEPEYIRQGIGRRLIAHAKCRAREGGGESLLIQGDPNTTDFYLAAGAVWIGERESDSVPGRYLPAFEIPLGRKGAA